MKKSPKKKIVVYSKGVSLVIALVITGVMVFFATAASITVVESIRQSASVNSANVAYYGAEGALEQGLYENLQQGTGYSTSTSQQVVLGEGDRTCNNLNSTSACQYCCYNTFNCTSGYVTGSPSHSICLSNQQNCIKACPTNPGTTGQQSLGDSKASYSIKGQVSSSDTLNGYNSIPTPGTGKAGKDCNPLAPPLTTTSYDPNIDMFAFVSDRNRLFAGLIWTAHAQADGNVETYPGTYPVTYPGSTSLPPITVQPEDHPCNWGTIKTGETVTIPLYYTDASGASRLLFTPSSSFELRLRTPCQDNNHYCYSNNRFLMDTATDDPIVAWQIYGQDSTSGKTYMLRPSSADIIKESDINSITSPNASTTFLDMNNQGTDLQKQTGTIKDFLTDGAPWANLGQHIKNPVFKFSVIHSLISTQTSSVGTNKIRIPYLEYQILTTGTYALGVIQPPTNEAQTITAEGTSGNFKQVLEVKVPQERGILEYVIQQ